MELGYCISTMKFSSVRINLTSLCRQSQMYLIKKCQESPSFLESWLKYLLSDTVIKKLKDKGTDTVKFEIKICLLKSEDQMHCACKITKAWIVKYFSVLLVELKKMENVKQIIAKFVTFEGFNHSIRAGFDNIALDDPDCTDKFLRMLLNLPDGDVHLCLLEKELRESGLWPLIQCQTGKDVALTGQSVTVKDIQRNLALLLDEIEPRRFVDMLRTMSNSDAIIKQVTSTHPRKERCRDFLNYIMKVGANAVSRFIPELERRGKHHIIEALSVKQTSMHQEMKIKEAVIFMHSEIIDEIEPRILRQTFVDRKLIKAEEFDAICKVPSRRARANQLLLYVLAQDTVVLNCLIDAMQVAGYRHLVDMTKQEMEKYTECPRLFEVSMKDKKAIEFKGEYKLNFETGFIPQSPLQVYLHKIVTPGEKGIDIDYSECFLLDDDTHIEKIRQERTQLWIQTLKSETVSSVKEESCTRLGKDTAWVVAKNIKAPYTVESNDGELNYAAVFEESFSPRFSQPSEDSEIQLNSQGKVCRKSTAKPRNDKNDQFRCNKRNGYRYRIHRITRKRRKKPMSHDRLCAGVSI